MAERQRQSLKLVASETPLPPEMECGGPRLDGYNDISTMLAEERGRQGVDQREVAASLRIRLSYIQAIEDGRFGDLPGPTYAIGFIRAYASYLGLDDEALAIEETLGYIYPDFCIYSPSSNSSVVGFLFVTNGLQTYDLNLVGLFSRII